MPARLNTPVTGGNVSFYNESPDLAVYPTPVIDMVGLIDDISLVTTSYFKQKGDEIAVIGMPAAANDGVGGSEYIKEIHGKVCGDAPAIDPSYELLLYKAVLEIIGGGLVRSAHDVSDGGLAVAIAESCIMDRNKPIGCKVSIEYTNRKDFELFGESQSRIIISFDPSNRTRIAKYLFKAWSGYVSHRKHRR